MPNFQDFIRKRKSRSITLDDRASQILKTNLKQLKVEEALSPETIHDMRVASRRLREALKTFKKIFPARVRKIQKELRKLGGLLGEKRDLDVFSEFILRTVTPASKLVRQMAKSEKDIQSTLQSKWYASLMGALEQLKPAKGDILKVSRKQMQKALNRVLEIAPLIDAKAADKTLHKLRISIKKLRYVCEFFAPLFSLGAFIEKTKGIQDVLGEYQDALTGISLLNRYRRHFSSEEFQTIEKKFELKKKKVRQAFTKLWKRYDLKNMYQK